MRLPGLSYSVRFRYVPDRLFPIVDPGCVPRHAAGPASKVPMASANIGNIRRVPAESLSGPGQAFAGGDDPAKAKPAPVSPRTPAFAKRSPERVQATCTASTSSGSRST